VKVKRRFGTTYASFMIESKQEIGMKKHVLPKRLLTFADVQGIISWKIKHLIIIAEK
jgi:hypothetical protein